MNVTKHGAIQLRKRHNIKKKNVDKQAKLAFSDGIRHNEVTGRLKKYFDKLFLTYETATNIRLYKGYIYIFCKESLVTTYPVPHQFVKVKRKNDKIEAKNYENFTNGL